MEYYLANAALELKVQQGVIRSARAAGNPFDTEYADPDTGFGNLLLTFEDREGRHHTEPLREASWEEQAPRREGHLFIYEGAAVQGALRIHVSYTLGIQGCLETVSVQNTGDEPVKLLDFGMDLAGHTDFGWGRDASKEVIGHHFVGGSGSHIAYYRCDGRGPILGIVPLSARHIAHSGIPFAAGPAPCTQPARGGFVYYTGVRKGSGPNRSMTQLYTLNAAVSESAVSKGAKLRIPAQSLTLEPGGCYEFCLFYFTAADYDDFRLKKALLGMPVTESVPGYTVVQQEEVLLSAESRLEDTDAGDDTGSGDPDASFGIISADRSAEITLLSSTVRKAEGAALLRKLYRVRFSSLGEHTLQVLDHGDCTDLYYFVTEPVETLLRKRAAFIAAHQEKDPEKWYTGLLCEWNNETGVRLSPDNYDRIGGWRIYEVSCDDPGLSKPAYLSSKQTFDPVQEEIDALDYYLDHFVWGGLQQTEEEPFPYGIYGIPDWHVLRNSEDPGLKGKKHIWRIYDYPHIALTWFNMYLTARSGARGTHTAHDALLYLHRAYRTALALFQIPMELDGWTALNTGLYNECVIPKIILALRREGLQDDADRLDGYWIQKVKFFATESEDIFGSEYPFDTTGFESTGILASCALELASFVVEDPRFSKLIPLDKAARFMENQISCNIACRGLLEPAYFWYGSDYRGNNFHYLLSYMSQMGGSAILDYAVYQAKDPYPYLRLAYGSLRSSFALINSGTEESGYGYWFPGIEHDGAAGGGFEAVYEGKTWLEQQHHGGSWYYSCEIDLGFCGAVRGLATVLADDPIFGRILYGGILRTEGDDGQPEALIIDPDDGVRKRFHAVGSEGKLHLALEDAQFAKNAGIRITKDEIRLRFDPGAKGCLHVMTEGCGSWKCGDDGSVIRDCEKTEITIRPGTEEIILQRV